MRPANRAAIAHATSGPFWVTHSSMAVSLVAGSQIRTVVRGPLLSRANFLLLEAIASATPALTDLLRMQSAPPAQARETVSSLRNSGQADQRSSSPAPERALDDRA